MGDGYRIARVVVIALILGSCASSQDKLAMDPHSDQLDRAELENSDVLAVPAEEVPRPAIDPLSERTQGYEFFDRGTGAFWTTGDRRRAAQASEAGDGVTLNFVQADVATVVKAVLDGVLKVNYVIDPDLKATITLQSAKPIPKAHVLAALENAFALSGVAMIDQDGTYQILPMSAAKRQAKRLRMLKSREEGPLGFGIQVVPLKYVQAEEMNRVIQPLLPADSIVSVDRSRNLIFLSGTAQELATGLDAIELFDVNWLKGMSFAMFQPEFASAEDLTEELLLIFDNAKNPMAGLVEFVPIPRMNGILVMAAEPELIEQSKVWIDRLDKRGDGPQSQIFVYYVQNSNAEEVTASLTAILSQQGGGASASARTQTTSASSSSDSSTGNSTSGRTQASGGTVSLGDGSDIRIVANNKSNAIMVYATARDYQMIEEAIKQLDVPVDQVLIEATIAEVTLTDEFKFGVEWFYQDGDHTVARADNSSGLPLSQFPGFSYTYFTTSTRAALNAIASLTDVKVLSSPKLVVLNNQTAMLQVGDQVPIATQSSVSTFDSSAPIVNSVQFRDTGVILEVTPRINRNGRVLLEVAQEVSDVVATTTSGIDSPTIQQRKVKSTVVIEDGQTIALGGLIRESDSLSDSGVPFLKDIPLLGQLFKSTDTNSRRTELLIFITPRIIRNMQDAEDVNTYLKDKLKHSKFFERAQEQ